MTRHFYTVSSSGMSRKLCGKAFNRGFNLRRHENEYCPLKSEEREMSETESHTMDSEDDASTTSTQGSESPMTTDNEMETEEEEGEEEKDPWMPMVEEAMQKHKAAFEEMKMNYIESGLDKQSADQKAYSDTRVKTHNLFWPDENSNEQCCAAHIVQCCQQYCSTLLHLIAG